VKKKYNTTLLYAS